LAKQGITHIIFNVPEAQRLAAYDLFYWEEKDLVMLDDFWKRYVKLVYQDMGDLSLPQKGLFSLKEQEPQGWLQYGQDIRKYVYLYEIMPEGSAGVPHEIPANFFLMRGLYPAERWKKLEPAAAKLLSAYQ
jgi:hypothetical protein